MIFFVLWRDQPHTIWKVVGIDPGGWKLLVGCFPEAVTVDGNGKIKDSCNDTLVKL